MAIDATDEAESLLSSATNTGVRVSGKDGGRRRRERRRGVGKEEGERQRSRERERECVLKNNFKRKHKQ